MKCPNCNFEVAENTKFCPECGTKMLENNAETTSSLEVTEEVSNAPSTTEVNELKKTKKKKIKKIIIISASALLACGIIFLVLWLWNPSCMFGHRNIHVKGEGATCTESGEHICDDCGKVAWSTSALGHDFYYQAVECNRCGKKRSCDEAYAEHEYENAVCGKENTCVKCGEKKTLQHKFEFDDSCDYCGKELFTINFSQTLPITISEDNTSKVVITNIEVNSYPSVSRNTFITFSIKKTYDRRGNSYSAYGKIGWKLYDSNGKVLDSGTGYSNGQLCVGEESEVEIKVSYLDYWSEYKLEVLDID